MGEGLDEAAPERRDALKGRQSPFVRRTLTVMGAAAITILLLVVLGRGIDVFLVTFAGVLLGIFLLAVRDGLVRVTRLPAKLALAVVMLALLGLTIGAAVWMAPRIGDQLDELSTRLPELWAEARTTLEQHAWGRQLLGTIDPEESINGATLVSVAATTTELFVFLVGFFVVGFFVAIQPRLYVNGLVALFPLGVRARSREIVDEMGTALRWFLVARAIAMLVVGVSTAILLHLLDIPLALLLGTIAVTGHADPGEREVSVSRSPRDSGVLERKLSGIKVRRNPGGERGQETSSSTAEANGARLLVAKFWN